MRVVVGERLGGPEVLGIAEREAPRPGPGEVVVDVAAAGVNYMDIYQREGVGNYRPEPPFVPGAEGAGKVSAVGEGVTRLAVGDRRLRRRLLGIYFHHHKLGMRGGGHLAGSP